MGNAYPRATRLSPHRPRRRRSERAPRRVPFRGCVGGPRTSDRGRPQRSAVARRLEGADKPGDGGALRQGVVVEGSAAAAEEVRGTPEKGPLSRGADRQNE